MTQSIHLSLDAMGGDFAPEIVIEGAAQSIIRCPNLKFTFLLKLFDKAEIINVSEI